MTKAKKYLPEVRARAVRTVLEYQGEYDSQWEKIGRTCQTVLGQFPVQINTL